jgi:hypothetical protein
MTIQQQDTLVAIAAKIVEENYPDPAQIQSATNVYKKLAADFENAGISPFNFIGAINRNYKADKHMKWIAMNEMKDFVR